MCQLLLMIIKEKATDEFEFKKNMKMYTNKDNLIWYFLI